MWLTISNPEFSPINVNWYESVLHAMAENRMLHAIAMTSGVVFTLIMEIGLPFLVWTRLRPYMVMGSAALHAGVGMFMGLTVFSLFMMVLVFCYIRPEAVRERTAGWPGLARLRLRFRSDNPRQLRSASLVRAVDVNAQVELIDTADESEDKRTTSIEVLGPEGQKATGISAFGLLLQKLRLGRKVLPLFWPFLALAGAFRSSSEQPPKPTSGKVVATR